MRSSSRSISSALTWYIQGIGRVRSELTYGALTDQVAASRNTACRMRWLSSTKSSTETTKQPLNAPSSQIFDKSISSYKERERIHEITRIHLLQKYPEIFPFSTGRTNHGQMMNSFHSQSASFPKLLELAGFRKVPLPHPNTDFVPLAEGVMALPKLPRKRRVAALYPRRPQQRSSTPYKKHDSPKHTFSASSTVATTTSTESLEIYVRSEPDSSYDDDKQKYTSLVEPDLTIYRILEERVDASLRQRHQSLQNWWHGILQHPLRTLRQFRQAMQQAIGIMPTSTSVASEDKNDETITTTESKQLISSSEKETRNNELESIILVDHEQQQTTWISPMDPSHRLLALPIQLSHKTASTLISVSLVVFGALPVTYRSIQFALAYPLAARAMAASVFCTILYGIYSARASARTNQARLIAQGLQERIQARNDAVVLLLEQEAMGRVAERIARRREAMHNSNERHPEWNTEEIQQWIDEEVGNLDLTKKDKGGVSKEEYQ